MSGARKNVVSDRIYPTIYQPNENFEYDYSHSNSLFLKAAHHPTKHEVINEVKLFPTVYPAYFWTLSNQTRYKRK